jgi:hypothetical protein
VFILLVGTTEGGTNCYKMTGLNYGDIEIELHKNLIYIKYHLKVNN